MSIRTYFVCCAVACAVLFAADMRNSAFAGGWGWWGWGRPCFVYRGGPVRTILGRVHHRWHGWRWGYGYGAQFYYHIPAWHCGGYYVDPWFSYPLAHPVGWPVCSSRHVYPNMQFYVDSAVGAMRQPPYRIAANDGALFSGNSARSDKRPATEDGALHVRGDSVVLDLLVPADAVVTINGHRTQSHGASRQYIARQLSPVRQYSFEIHAVIQRGGKEFVHSTQVASRTGQRLTVSMDEVAFQQAPATTTLVVHVPAEARLIVAGATSKQDGETRIFTTTALPENQSWEGYRVVAELEREGKILREEKTLVLQGGAHHELAFRFTAPEAQVAAR